MGRACLERVLHDPRAGIAVVLAVFALTYARAASHDFVWDDFDNVVENPHYETALGESLRSTQIDHLDPTLLGAAELPVAYESYRPLLFLSYRLDAATFGRASAAMHVHNLILGALAIALAGWIFVQLLPDPRSALLATAVFALHPLQAETLCYVSARGGLLAALLALLATGAFCAALGAGAAPRRRAVATLVAAVAFLASLAAKESWATLPVALAGIALVRHRMRAAVMPLAALCVVPCVYLALRVLLIGSELSSVDPAIGFRALGNAPAHALAYLRIVAIPSDLSIERLAAVSGVGWWAGWVFWIAVGLAVARGAAPSRAGAKSGLVAAGLLWFGVLLVPAAVAIETMGVRADRYAFLPLFGAALAVGASSEGLWRRVTAGQNAIPAAAGIWVVTCLIVTIGQVSVWRDNDSLYTHSVLVEPTSAMAHYRLGVLAVRSDDWVDALDHFQTAARLDDSNVFVLNNLGVAYLNLGRLDDAEFALRRVLAISETRHFRAWNNLAQVHFARAEREHGCRALERSLAINPAYSFAQQNHAHYCAPDPRASTDPSGAGHG